MNTQSPSMKGPNPPEGKPKVVRAQRKPFANLIRERRQQRRMTQAFLARRTGISRNYLSLLERGIDRNPSLKVFHRLLQVLSLDYYEILFEE